MYVKQNEASDVHETPSIHEGEGVILRRSMFREQSKLPIRMEVWELEPGVSEGDHTHEGNGELEEIYYFLEGKGVMSVEGEDVPIACGRLRHGSSGGRSRVPQHRRQSIEAGTHLGQAGGVVR